MAPSDIVPQRTATPGVLVRTDTETVARVKHHPHGLGHCRDVERVALRFGGAEEAHVGEPVFPFPIGLVHLDEDVELPERVARVGVEAVSLGLRDVAANGCCSQLIRISRAIHAVQAVHAVRAVSAIRAVGSTRVAVLAAVRLMRAAQAHDGDVVLDLPTALCHDQGAAAPCGALHLAVVEQGAARDVPAIVGRIVLQAVGMGGGAGLDLVVCLGGAYHDGLEVSWSFTLGVGRALGLDAVAVQEVREVIGVALAVGVARFGGLRSVAEEGRALLMTPTVGRGVWVPFDIVELLSRVAGRHGDGGSGCLGRWQMTSRISAETG